MIINISGFIFINSMKHVLYSESFRKGMIVVLIALCAWIFNTSFQHIGELNDKLNDKLNGLYSIDIVLLKAVILIPVIFLIYYGYVLALKIAIIKIEHVTKKHIIRNDVIISGTACCSIIGIIFICNADPNTNKAELGILFEIIGFIIYLTPVTKYLSKVIKDTEDKINNDLIVKTSAVIFVISGLFLQLLYS